MIQERINLHLESNKYELEKLSEDIESLSLSWPNSNGYGYNLSGHTVPKFMPWKYSDHGYRTALSNEKFDIVQQLLKGAPEGTCVEFGVFTGGVTRMMLDAGRKVYAFDTFNGVHGAGKNDIHSNGDYNGGDVSEYIKGAVIVKGFVPDTLSIETGVISFAHIDMDVYEPTACALKYVYERLHEKGVIVLDDYGNITTPGVKKAVDEFKKGRKLFLPNSQMIIFKE